MPRKHALIVNLQLAIVDDSRSRIPFFCFNTMLTDSLCSLNLPPSPHQKASRPDYYTMYVRHTHTQQVVHEDTFILTCYCSRHWIAKTLKKPPPPYLIMKPKFITFSMVKKKGKKKSILLLLYSLSMLMLPLLFAKSFDWTLAG